MSVKFTGGIIFYFTAPSHPSSRSPPPPRLFVSMRDASLWRCDRVHRRAEVCVVGSLSFKNLYFVRKKRKILPLSIWLR